jgi:hypothetical protein
VVTSFMVEAGFSALRAFTASRGCAGVDLAHPGGGRRRRDAGRLQGLRYGCRQLVGARQGGGEGSQQEDRNSHAAILSRGRRRRFHCRRLESGENEEKKWIPPPGTPALPSSRRRS